MRRYLILRECVPSLTSIQKQLEVNNLDNERQGFILCEKRFVLKHIQVTEERWWLKI